MKVLILGAGGFIGGSLFEALKKDDRFTEVEGQSRRYKPGLYMRSPAYILYKRHFDVILNCSGRANPAGDWVDMWDDNVIDLIKTLSYAGNKENPPLFIHLSSIVVENSPLTLYAASKASSEIVVKSFTDLGMIKGVILRPCGVVGANVTHGMLHDVIRRLKDKPEKLDILGSYPGASKPYIHVDELISVMKDFSLGYNKIEDRPFDICSKDTLSVESVINIILKTLDIEIELNWKGCPWVDQPFVKPISDFNMRSATEVIKTATREIWDKINAN